VACAEGAEFGVVANRLLKLGDAGGLEQRAGVVGEVAGPVGAGLLRRGGVVLAGKKAVEKAAADECAGGFEEFAFVHLYGSLHREKWSRKVQEGAKATVSGV
jgi:hypothetical protein